MQNLSEDGSITEEKVVDFGSIPVDTVAEKSVWVHNQSVKCQTYRVSLIYVLNNVDRVFNVSVTSAPVKPRDSVEVRISFRPNIAGQAFTDYYLVDDTAGNTYRVTVSGRCFGPEVSLSKRKLKFRICKNVDEKRKAVINIVNKSAVETTYQWLLPLSGQGYFQILELWTY
ncbi:cilia- and flagella-associated protein 65-like [Choristoneura fumiferana]|uniref:cilia- and flagella-associated protein 65-like n=1 Tax=Choristoneura fumiferana TaxID=7141 RepID=UPI003D1570CE